MTGGGGGPTGAEPGDTGSCGDGPAAAELETGGGGPIADVPGGFGTRGDGPAAADPGVVETGGSLPAGADPKELEAGGSVGSPEGGACGLPICAGMKGSVADLAGDAFQGGTTGSWPLAPCDESDAANPTATMEIQRKRMSCLLNGRAWANGVQRATSDKPTVARGRGNMPLNAPRSVAHVDLTGSMPIL